MLSAIDPNEAYNNVMQMYKSLFEISCPVKTTKINKKYIKREPWITSGLLVSSINKDKLLRRKLHKPNTEREKTFSINGEKVSNYSIITEEFNNFFAKIGTTVSESVPSPTTSFNSHLKINLLYISSCNQLI